jgi:hypothetical protein
MICVGVTLYFSARDTISGLSRTGEYPGHFEESVSVDTLLFIKSVCLPLGVYAVRAMPFLVQ